MNLYIWKKRATYYGLDPEYVIFLGSIAWNFGGIEDDGELKLIEQNDGSIQTCLDKYNSAAQWILANEPDILFINTAKRWVDAGVAIHGDLRTATIASGKGGAIIYQRGVSLE